MGINEDQLSKVFGGMFVTFLRYTSGKGHARVMACGEDGPFETYRCLYAQGSDISTRHRLATLDITAAEKVTIIAAYKADTIFYKKLTWCMPGSKEIHSV